MSSQTRRSHRYDDVTDPMSSQTQYRHRFDDVTDPLSSQTRRRHRLDDVTDPMSSQTGRRHRLADVITPTSKHRLTPLHDGVTYELALIWAVKLRVPEHSARPTAMADRASRLASDTGLLSNGSIGELAAHYLFTHPLESERRSRLTPVVVRDTALNVHRLLEANDEVEWYSQQTLRERYTRGDEQCPTASRGESCQWLRREESRQREARSHERGGVTAQVKDPAFALQWHLVRSDWTNAIVKSDSCKLKKNINYCLHV